MSETSAAFRSLFAAIEEQGERAGWLDLEVGGSQSPADANDDGAWKTVRVEARRSVAVKRRRGPAVLDDLLREHFRGCRLVLVRGDAALPTLRSRGDAWELESPSGELRRLTTAELTRALRAPRLPV